MYAVVLAGGGGTRLWPLSRPECPKPFLKLLGDETLIQRTVARLAPLIEPRDVYVVAERRHLALAAEQLPAIPAANLIGEPIGRNTAAAVALAAEAIDRPDDEVMLVLAADAHIADEADFRATLTTAAEVARGGSLVTLGVTPDRPETGYGYVIARPPAREVAGRPTFAVDQVRREAFRRASRGDDRDRPGELEREHLLLDARHDPRPPGPPRPGHPGPDPGHLRGRHAGRPRRGLPVDPRDLDRLRGHGAGLARGRRRRRSDGRGLERPGQLGGTAGCLA